MIFGDKLDRTWKQIVSFGRSDGAPDGSAPVTPPVFDPGEAPLPLREPEAMMSSRAAGEHED